MAQRYTGNLRIRVRFTGRTDSNGRGEYEGNIHVPEHGNWSFKELYIHPEDAYDSPDTYDRVAEAAVDFGGYYGSYNREDTPEWAPSAELADAIQSNQEWDVTDEFEEFPDIPGVFLGENAVIFRSMRAREHYVSEFERQRQRLAKKPKLTLIQGGLFDAA